MNLDNPLTFVASFTFVVVVIAVAVGILRHDHEATRYIVSTALVLLVLYILFVAFVLAVSPR